MEEAAAYHSGVNGKDALLARRAEFMYNFFDYDNDRERIRTRFLEEANKRTTLKDIGEALDKFMLDEKAKGLTYMNAENNDSLPKSATQDSSSFELSWTGRIFKDTDPLKPLLLDDASPSTACPRTKTLPTETS